MTKDEMKNRISMALKDPILQQGFEIICKNLETEKKLNAEIKARFVKCNTCTDEMKSKCLMFSENLCQGERCEELVDLMSLINKTELEKENAELKADNDARKFAMTMSGKVEKQLREQIAEAKEIIREYLSLLDKLHNTIIFNIDEDLEHKAEAFLKE